MSRPRIGVIGGSGLYNIEGFTDQKWVKLKTPFGPFTVPQRLNAPRSLTLPVRCGTRKPDVHVVEVIGNVADKGCRIAAARILKG